MRFWHQNVASRIYALLSVIRRQMTAFVLFGGGLPFFLKESFPYLAFKRFEKHCLCASGGRCFDCIPGSDIKVARFHLKGDNRWLVLTTVNNFSVHDKPKDEHQSNGIWPDGISSTVETGRKNSRHKNSLKTCSLLINETVSPSINYQVIKVYLSNQHDWEAFCYSHGFCCRGLPPKGPPFEFPHQKDPSLQMIYWALHLWACPRK